MTVLYSGTSFAQEVAEKSQAHLAMCSQCLACGSGCPVAFALDYTPNQIIRMVQLGLRDKVLGSSAIWLCASCETCAARCPYGVDIVRIMDALREMALAEDKVGEKAIAGFHSAFITSVRERGRIHELSLIARYSLTSGDVLRRLPGYISLGLKMLFRGRVILLPGKKQQGLKRIFQLSEK